MPGLRGRRSSARSCRSSRSPMSTRSSGCRTTTTTAWPPRCGPRTSRRPSTRREPSGRGSCGSTTRSPPPPRCPGAATSNRGSAGSSARTASRTTWRRSPSTSTWPSDPLQDDDGDDPARLALVVGEPRGPALLLLPDALALLALRHPCPGVDGLVTHLDGHIGVRDQVVVPVGVPGGPAPPFPGGPGPPACRAGAGGVGDARCVTLPPVMGGGEVKLVDLVKRFADVTAVAGINLEMQPGEFFSLLGPSGCGKTTTLRLIAGFERPDEGQILLDDADMAQVPPHKRNVNTVFQNYALFPHLNVFDNVAFGLRYKDVAKQEIKQKVGDSLALVRLEGMQKRRPSQLSGGQQQRVALARALILNPAVLLLDEPLGALDAKLRKRLQIELKALQEEVGITFIYVTHDQEEALTMSDRIAVMSQGRVEQVGPPEEIYEEPATAYVADFLGVSNLMPAKASGRGDGACKVSLGDFDLLADKGEEDT